MPYRPPDHPDAVWHVTSRVNHQAWHLAPEHAQHVFLKAFDAAVRAFDVDVLAWVVMSNHFHGVLRSPAEEEFQKHTGRRTECRHFRPYPPGSPRSSVIGQCMAKWKLSVCNELQRQMDVSGHFWEGRHKRQLITSPRSLVARIAYDHRNPVRKAMAARAEDYPRSSAAWWTHGTPGPIEIMRRSDLPFGLDFDCLRKSVVLYQESKIIDDIFEGVASRHLKLDSEAGLKLLRQLMDDAGIPLPAAARLPHQN